MKNIIKLALATAAAALMLPSCNEWIDIPVEATVPAETIDYTRQEGIQELVTGSYRRFMTQGIAEWEIVMILAPANIKDDIMSSIYSKAGLSSAGQGIIFSLPVTRTAGLTQVHAEDEGDKV